jgi:hypothetical protein
MSGTFELAPGVETEWLGNLAMDEVLKNFEIQGGQPCWRPHIPGDVQRLLFEMGQIVLDNDKAPIPADKIPTDGLTEGYPNIIIDNNVTVEQLDRELYGY